MPRDLGEILDLCSLGSCDTAVERNPFSLNTVCLVTRKGRVGWKNIPSILSIRVCHPLHFLFMAFCFVLKLDELFLDDEVLFMIVPDYSRLPLEVT